MKKGAVATREKWSKARTGKKYDRRLKLTDEDRLWIKELYDTGAPIRKIARIFEKRCSRRLIQFIIFSERLKLCNFPGHWKKYYDKDKWREQMRRHRSHLRLLLKSKKI